MENMVISLKLGTFQTEIIKEMIKQGIATNKSEAIRMSLNHYNEHFNLRPLRPISERDLETLAVEKMKAIDSEIQSGKRKTISEEEFLSRHSHLKKV